MVLLVCKCSVLLLWLNLDCFYFLQKSCGTYMSAQNQGEFNWWGREGYVGLSLYNPISNERHCCNIIRWVILNAMQEVNINVCMFWVIRFLHAHDLFMFLPPKPKLFQPLFRITQNRAHLITYMAPSSNQNWTTPTPFGLGSLFSSCYPYSSLFFVHYVCVLFSRYRIIWGLEILGCACWWIIWFMLLYISGTC